MVTLKVKILQPLLTELFNKTKEKNLYHSLWFNYSSNQIYVALLMVNKCLCLMKGFNPTYFGLVNQIYKQEEILE